MTLNPYEAPQSLPLPPPPPQPSSWRRGLGTLSLFLSALLALLALAVLVGYLYQRWHGLNASGFGVSFLGGCFLFLSLIFGFMGRLFYMTDPESEESSDE